MPGGRYPAVNMHPVLGMHRFCTVGCLWMPVFLYVEHLLTSDRNVSIIETSTFSQWRCSGEISKSWL